MKRHYEIMRIMRTKILSMRELQEGAQGIVWIREAIFYRVQDLTCVSVSSSTVACYVNLTQTISLSRDSIPRNSSKVSLLGLWVICHFPDSSTLLTCFALQFKYYHNENALWSMDYIRSLDPQV